MRKSPKLTPDKKRGNDVENNLKETADNLRSIADNLWTISSFTIQSTLKAGGFVIKNTPKAIVAVAETRRKISESLVDTYEEMEKEKREKEFDDKFKEKIEQIKLKNKK